MFFLFSVINLLQIKLDAGTNINFLNNTSLAAKKAFAYQLQHRTTCNTTPHSNPKMATRGLQKGQQGLERDPPWLIETFNLDIFKIGSILTAATRCKDI